MTAKLDKSLTLIFSLIWAFLIFIDYWYYHQGYALAIKYFQYTDTMLILSILGLGVFFGGKKLRQNKNLSFLTGGSGMLILFMLVSGIILWTHYPKISGQNVEFIRGIIFLAKIGYILFCCYFVFLTCYVLGGIFVDKLFTFSFNHREDIILKIALGITLISITLMLLGAFGLLTFFVILPPFIGILGIRWKRTLAFLKVTLFAPLDDKKQLNWIGFTSFFVLLIFISLNFLSNVRPFPFGFDALATYLNLPNLISNQHSIIESYSPYYWSLFVSLGHIIFDKTEVVIALSIGGGILSLFVIFEICRKWLDLNFSLLTVLIFYSLPFVNYQSFRDIKTDLGLLFFLLVTLLVLIKWLSLIDNNAFQKKIEITPIKNKKKRLKSKQRKTEVVLENTNKEKIKQGWLGSFFTEDTQLVIILGILSGFSIGIKLTGLIMIFAVLSVFSFMKGGKIGFLTNFALTFFVVLMANLDTSLRTYHFEVDKLKWITLLIGLGGLLYLGYKHRKDLMGLIKVSLVYILFLGLVYLPWPIKNYMETGNLSAQTFIKGKEIGVPK